MTCKKCIRLVERTSEEVHFFDFTSFTSIKVLSCYPMAGGHVEDSEHNGHVKLCFSTESLFWSLIDVRAPQLEDDFLSMRNMRNPAIWTFDKGPVVGSCGKGRTGAVSVGNCCGKATFMKSNPRGALEALWPPQ